MNDYNTRRSLAAETAFHARLTEFGATLLEPKWLGGLTPHRVRCAEGHESKPRPADVQQGIGICRTCSGKDPKAAEAAFRAHLAEHGVTLLEPTWLGVHKPHRARCSVGHDCKPNPTTVRRGGGICAACSGNDPRMAEAAFRSRLVELGATLLEPAWLGKDKPHRVRCAEGHNCKPRPSQVRDGGGICATCSGNDPRAAEEAFLARLAQLDATLLEPTWLGANRPHRVRCFEGHDCTPRPAHVRDGNGICLPCSGQVWDVLYVVMDETAEVVKIGITSGDPRPRLAKHRLDDLDQVVRLLTKLPDGVARELERNVLAALRDVGERPTRGREYFPGRALALMLDLIDHHPAVRGTQTAPSSTITGPSRC